MRIVRTLLAFGLVAASVAVLRGRRRALRGARSVDVSVDDTDGTSVPVSPKLYDRWYQDTAP